jgi:hypothetical protein
VTAYAELCVELHWLEVLYVLRVKEHVSDDGLFLVDSERVACNNDSLKDHSEGIGRKGISSC